MAEDRWTPAAGLKDLAERGLMERTVGPDGKPRWSMTDAGRAYIESMPRGDDDDDEARRIATGTMPRDADWDHARTAHEAAEEFLANLPAASAPEPVQALLDALGNLCRSSAATAVDRLAAAASDISGEDPLLLPAAEALMGRWGVTTWSGTLSVTRVDPREVAQVVLAAVVEAMSKEGTDG